MAIVIYPDIINGTNYFEDDKSGNLQRIFRVDGLESNNGITTAALYATDAGGTLPRAGEPHPSLSDLVVRRVAVSPVRGSKTCCWLAFEYVKVRRRLLDVRLNGVTVQALSKVDKDGNRARIGYKGEATEGGAKTPPGTKFPPAEAAAPGYVYSTAEDPVPIPQKVLEIVYLENGSPNAKQKKFVRKLNKRPWQDGEAREWFCESITGQIESPIPQNLADLPDQLVVRGKARFYWIVTYRFLHRKKPTKIGNRVTDSPGWDTLDLFIDPNYGTTPTDIDPLKGGWPTQKSGNGWLEVERFNEEDFDELDLVSAVEEGINP